MKIAVIETYPLVLAVREIYGGAAGFLEDCRTMIVRMSAWADASMIVLTG